MLLLVCRQSGRFDRRAYFQDGCEGCSGAAPFPASSVRAARYSIYLLYWYKGTDADIHRQHMMPRAPCRLPTGSLSWRRRRRSQVHPSQTQVIVILKREKDWQWTPSFLAKRRVAADEHGRGPSLQSGAWLLTSMQANLF